MKKICRLYKVEHTHTQTYIFINSPLAPAGGLSFKLGPLPEAWERPAVQYLCLFECLTCWPVWPVWPVFPWWLLLLSLRYSLRVLELVWSPPCIVKTFLVLMPVVSVSSFSQLIIPAGYNSRCWSPLSGSYHSVDSSGLALLYISI